MVDRVEGMGSRARRRRAMAVGAVAGLALATLGVFLALRRTREQRKLPPAPLLPPLAQKIVAAALSSVASVVAASVTRKLLDRAWSALPPPQAA